MYSLLINIIIVNINEQNTRINTLNNNINLQSLNSTREGFCNRDIYLTRLVAASVINYQRPGKNGVVHQIVLKYTPSRSTAQFGQDAEKTIAWIDLAPDL